MNQLPEANTQPVNETETIGIKAVAHSLGVSKATVLRWVRAGRVEGFFRIGHKWLIRKSAFDALIEQKIINSSKQTYESQT